MRRGLIFTAVALLSYQAYALELHNARVLDSHEWSTGKAHGHFESKQELPKSRVAYTSAEGRTTTAHAKSNVTIYGEHTFRIVNETTATQLYSYEYSLCAGVDNCIYKLQHVEISPEGSMTDAAQSTLVQWFDDRGYYYSRVQTKVAGESGDESNDQALINII